jgi:AcrR family transcriptional regulator
MKRISRQEQKENTRQGLIHAATGLFASRGISQTATADVAQTLKVSHGTVFTHFPTRDDLILAVIDQFGEQLAKEFEHCLVDKNLKEILNSHIKVLAEYEDFYFRLQSEINFLPAPVKSMVFMLNNAVSFKMFEAAQLLMKAGELKKMDRSQFFNTWIAMVNYHILNRELLTDKIPILKEKGTELIKHFLYIMKQ